MKIRANFPAVLPAWATTGGTQLQPTAGEVSSGFGQDDVVPAKYLNYLLDMANKWVKPQMATVISNYAITAAAAAATFNNVIWSTSQQLWYVTNALATNGYYSEDGINWLAGAATIVNVTTGSKTQDATGRIILGNSAGNVLYKTDVTTGTFSSTTPGIAGVIVCRTKDTGDFVVAMTVGALGIATAPAVTGSWTLRTGTQPAAMVDIQYVTSQTWVAVTSGGDVYVSADDCVSWGLQGSAGGATFVADALDIEPTTGRIIVVGHNSSGNAMEFYYSDDLGVSWSSNVAPAWNTGGAAVCVRNIGGIVWTASTIHGGPTGTVQFGSFYSIDNGATWFVMKQTTEDIISPYHQIYDIGYNGGYWLSVGQNYFLKGLNHQYD